MNKLAILIAGMILTASLKPSFAVDEGEDVQSRRGNPSPGKVISNINEYTFQDEQVNLGPDDEDVLVIRTDQKVNLNRFVVKTFPLKNVTPREIRNIFRELTGKEGGRAEVIRDKKTRDNWLQVIVPTWVLPYIEKVIPALDEEWVRQFDDGSAQAYYTARHREIAAVKRLVDNWGGEGDSFLDPRNNAALISDEPYRVASWIEKGAKVVDVPEHQGNFKITVYEINTNNDLKLGLDYGAWKNGPGRNLFDVGAAGYDIHGHYRNASSFLDPLNHRDVLPNYSPQGGNDLEFSSYFYTANYMLTAAYVDFLASKGRAKVMAQSTIQVVSGSEGSLGSTDQVVTFDVQPNDAGPFGIVPTRLNDPDAGDPNLQTGDYSTHPRTVRRRGTGEVGFSVDIEPVILKETMEVKIHVRVSNVEGYTPQGLPIINASQIDTTARLTDGSIMVISGLTRDEKVNSKSGMPFLGSLPGLGYLFGGENNINRKKQLVVVIESETEVGDSYSKLSNPVAINTIKNQVKDGSQLKVPKTSFGFDMWLMGGKAE